MRVLFRLLLIFANTLAHGAGAVEAANPADRPLRIAIGYFYHEAMTFSPETAGISDFRKPNLTGELLLEHGASISGFVQFALESRNVTLIPLESPNDVLGGFSKGWIDREAFEHYVDLMMNDLKKALPVDAVYLSMHGAAAVVGVERPEAELAKRVRAIVGPETPIAGTFDPHGNEDEKFLQYANFSFAMKYFPHFDGRLQGERAARMLIRSARGDYVSTTATRKPGIITPTVLQWTGQEPWMGIVNRALTWEAREKDAYVSFFFGFPWSDVRDVGATFQVMTNGDQELADRIAQDMSNYMWDRRYELFSTQILRPREAVKNSIKATKKGETPIVLADYSDRTGDATHILKEIVDQGLGGVIYATLRDEHTIAALRESRAKPGDPFDRKVGGFVMPEASGEPVRIRGTLRYLGRPAPLESMMAEDALVAVIEFGRGNWLVLTPTTMQIRSPALMQWFPIKLEKFTTWVIKSRAHFRRGFDDTGYAKTIMIVDAPGPYIGTVHLEALPYENVDLKKLFPFNEGGIEEVSKLRRLGE